MPPAPILIVQRIADSRSRGVRCASCELILCKHSWLREMAVSCWRFGVCSSCVAGFLVPFLCLLHIFIAYFCCIFLLRTVSVLHIYIAYVYCISVSHIVIAHLYCISLMNICIHDALRADTAAPRKKDDDIFWELSVCLMSGQRRLLRLPICLFLRCSLA